jgi:hypothetical protein
MSVGLRLEGFTEVKIYSMAWGKITEQWGVVHGYKLFIWAGRRRIKMPPPS